MAAMPLESGVRMQQGYLYDGTPSNDEHGALVPGVAGGVVRVRLAGARAWITIKGPNTGIVRTEFEYAIPADDAATMLATLCTRAPIDKTRYRLPAGTLVWELDVFHGANAPLVLAEIELPSATALIELPAWVGAEVSTDPRFFNSHLYQYPYSSWAQARAS